MNPIEFEELKALLEQKYEQYNHPAFIDDDPIQVPHRFSNKEDIEIAGFLVATIAWGNRKSILTNGIKLIRWMDDEPYNFVMNAGDDDLHRLEKFVHRTFNGTDLRFFMLALHHIYKNHGGLETVFSTAYLEKHTLFDSIAHFRQVFFELPHLSRTGKHVANVQKNASAKRICMFLRWMVRNDGRGVDFGIWKQIPAAALMLPLDLHTGNIARKLGLLNRTQNDWKAVEELTENLRKFDATDPVKYDYALFGMGVHKDI